jgi:phenylacetate-coenzyme A ligase PaaK-like adenylate-forming protein
LTAALRCTRRDGVLRRFNVLEMTPSPSQRSWLGAAKAEVAQRSMDHAPAVVKDVVASVVGEVLFRRRRGRAFQESLRRWYSMQGLSRDELLRIQLQNTHEIVVHASTRSPYYAAKYAGIASRELADLPILEKEELRENIAEIVVHGRGRLRQYYTGGTTGKSLVVYSSADSDGERFARQEAMWAMHGYELGRDRIAWFSGRHLIGANDVSAHRFWRNNLLKHIRYYSTFHMAPPNLPYYAEDLARFRPAFLTGFPSAIGELARFIEMAGEPRTFDIQAVFTTSETLTPPQRETIERVFNCPVRNQYASSEGAPWIMECRRGRLHVDVTSGVFEVLDRDGRPADDGEVLVTSFYMKETPLIRYRIGDRVILSDERKCPCGWDTPLAASIEGRASDFIEVPGRGRIFASQIGDCVKHLHWVLAFRCQMRGEHLHVEMVADRERFEKEDKATFLSNIRERMGDIVVDLEYLDELPRLPSGKQSVVAAR